MPLPRLLILPALAVLFVLALTASPAAAQVTDCPCWPGGPPVVGPAFCYQSPTAQLNTFAYLTSPPAFLQVTNGWCRNNGTFKWVTPAEAQVCHQQLQCLCSNADLRPDELCNGTDDNCDGFVDEGFPLGQFCEVGLGDCRETGGLICDPTDDTATICDATPGTPSEIPETTCSGGGDEDCDGQADCADSDCAWSPSDLPDLTCKDPVCGDSIVDNDEDCDGGDCCTVGCDFEAEGMDCGINEVCQREVCAAAGACVLETLPGTCDAAPPGANNLCDASTDVCQSGVCTDTDPAPSLDICDGIDNDCDGTVDEGTLEVCDGVDNDCDGAIDEGGVICTCPCEDAMDAVDFVCDGTVLNFGCFDFTPRLLISCALGPTFDNGDGIGAGFSAGGFCSADDLNSNDINQQLVGIGAGQVEACLALIRARAASFNLSCPF